VWRRECFSLALVLALASRVFRVKAILHVSFEKGMIGDAPPEQVVQMALIENRSMLQALWKVLEEFKERRAKFGLELHPEKTWLIEFGRYAAGDRQRLNWDVHGIKKDCKFQNR
jgi:hypothetical protein